jgi:hypothetical protein
MIQLHPAVLEGHGVRLEPLEPAHAGALATAASDGKLWELWFTSVPDPAGTATYIEDALAGQQAGHMLPWVVTRALHQSTSAPATTTSSRPVDQVEIANRTASRGSAPT